MLVLHPVTPDTPGLVAALGAAQLPTEDLVDPGRAFFRLDNDGSVIGYGGYELYGVNVLLRSVVVLPEMRGKGFGRKLTQEVLRAAHRAGARQAYLLTTSAEEFFKREGFVPLERAGAPREILETKQASSICSTASLLERPLDG